MDGFTIFMIVVVLAAAAVGWSKGLVRQLSQVAALLLGVVAARVFGPAVREMLGEDTMVHSLMAYVIVFGGVYVAVWLGARLLGGAIRALHLGALDRTGGAIFSLFKWLVLVSLIVNVYEAVLPGNKLSQSKTYGLVLRFGPELLGTDAVTSLRSTLGT